MRIGTGVLSLAAALAASPAARADDVPPPSVRVVHIDWGSLDLPGRAAPDHATLSQRTTTMPEAGTWVRMAPRLPHSVVAETPVVMLLLMLR